MNASKEMIKYQLDGEDVYKISSAELQKNLKNVINLLKSGAFIELTKHGVKVGMIVPY